MNIHITAFKYKIDMCDFTDIDVLLNKLDDHTECLQYAIEMRISTIALQIIDYNRYNLQQINDIVIEIIDNSPIIELLEFFTDDMSDVVNALLSNGVIIPNKTYRDHTSLFMLICNLRHTKMATILLKHGYAYPEHIDDNGDTPLICALRNNLIDVALALVETGCANVMNHNMRNISALHLICKYNHIDLLTYIIDHNLCYNAQRDIYDKYPCDYLYERGHTELSTIMKLYNC